MDACTLVAAGRPTFMPRLRAATGRLVFLRSQDSQAKGVVERLQGYLESNFEPGRQFVNHLDFQLQLDAWFRKTKRACTPRVAGPSG